MSGIFLLQKDGQLVEMNEQEYDSEGLLQELLAKYPSLLAGSQMNSEKPRRWLLVCREAGVPAEEDGSDRWSIDHLFLDQDAIPTLVEVKRSSDTRIRREVVGQMLDYAANAVLYWPVEEIRAKFAARCEEDETDPGSQLDEFLAGEMEAEQFWIQVKTNLQVGKIRLVFVADEIPNELRRIVEFLNQQMEFAEVLAVEIKQFVGEGLKTLVPRVMGQTAESERAKSRGTSAGRDWDEASFLAELEERAGAGTTGVARRLLDWSKRKASRIYFAQGAQSGSFIPVVTHDGQDYQLFRFGGSGSLRFWFRYLRRKKPFDAESKRMELLGRLNQVPGVSIPPTSIGGMPRIPVQLLESDSGYSAFTTILDWVIEQIKAS